jgi:hypothetical protein
MTRDPPEQTIYDSTTNYCSPAKKERKGLHII